MSDLNEESQLLLKDNHNLDRNLPHSLFFLEYDFWGVFWVGFHWFCLLKHTRSIFSSLSQRG